MKPYYDEDGITIYHGDCRDVLPLVSATVLLTDPPYDAQGEWAVSISSQYRTAAIFGYPEYMVSWCIAAETTPAEWVTWWPSTPKPVSGGGKLPCLSEVIAVFGEVTGGPQVRGPRVTVNHKGLNRIRGERDHSTTTKRLGDVWTDPAPNVGFHSHRRLHPNEKPVPVLHKLIRLCDVTGDDVVVDPFMGSGTTLRAAKDLGLRAIGIEIDESYCEVAVSRLSQGVLPLT